MSRIKGKVKWPLLLATLLVLLVAFAGAALATDWPEFQKDTVNSGIAVDSPPISGSPTSNMVDLPNASWSGIDTTPLIVDESGTKYAYVLDDVGDDGAKVYKIKCSDRTKPAGWTNGVVVDTKGGFELCTPAIVGSTMYLGVTDMYQRLTNPNFDSSLGGWSTEAAVGNPTIEHYSDSGNGCARIYQSSASTTTRGSIYQTTATQINAEDKVRVAFKYYLGGGSNPTSCKIRVKIQKPGEQTQTTIYENTSPTVGSWTVVNDDFTSSFGVTGQYTIYFEAEYTSGASGSHALFDECQLITEGLLVKKITNINTSSPTVSIVCANLGGGQFNTPITYETVGENVYLYLGSWKGEGTGKYFKIKVSDGTTTSFTPDAEDGFYWAGAAIVGNYLVFGGEKSKVYVLNKSDMSLAASYTIKGSGNGQEANAKEIRSSICYNSANNEIYFTDKGGWLWCLSINTGNGSLTHRWHANIGYSTSTPAYYNSTGRIYVGQGGVGGSGKVHCRNRSDGSAVWEYSTGGGVQSSPVVYRSGDYTYIYYTTNSSSGKGYCLRNDDVNNTRSIRWTVPSSGGTYTLQGMAASGDYVVFGNDYGEIYFVW